MTTIANIQRRVASINIANGWREDVDPHDIDVQVTRLALAITEASEAVEEVRNGHALNETYYPTKPYVDDDGIVHNGYVEAPFKPEGVPSELADVAIRLLDSTDTWGTDLGAVLADLLGLEGDITIAAISVYVRGLEPALMDALGYDERPSEQISTIATLFVIISRAIDAIASGESPDSHIADAFVGLVLICTSWGIDLEAAIDEKLTYNATRGHRHGGKAA